MKHSAVLLMTLPLIAFSGGPFDKTFQEEIKAFTRRTTQNAEAHVPQCGNNGAYQLYLWLDTQFMQGNISLLDSEMEEGQAIAQQTFDDPECAKKLNAFSEKAKELAAAYQELFSAFHRTNKKTVQEKTNFKVASPVKAMPNEDPTAFKKRAVKEGTRQFFTDNAELTLSPPNKKDLIRMLISGMMCRQTARMIIQNKFAFMKEWDDKASADNANN